MLTFLILDFGQSSVFLQLKEVVRATGPCFEFYVVESETGRCDEEVESTLKKCLRPRDIASVDLTKTVVICSKLKHKEVDEINGECLQRIDGELKCYTALDSDNNGKQLREADEQRLRRISTRLPDELSLKEGRRVVLRRNLDIYHRVGSMASCVWRSLHY